MTTAWSRSNSQIAARLAARGCGDGCAGRLHRRVSLGHGHVRGSVRLERRLLGMAIRDPGRRQDAIELVPRRSVGTDHRAVDRRRHWQNFFTCATCGTQYRATETAPEKCAICEDERQYVGPNGQQWTTLKDLAAGHHNVLRRLDSDLLGIGTHPDFAIGKRGAPGAAPGR